MSRREFSGCNLIVCCKCKGVVKAKFYARIITLGGDVGYSLASQDEGRDSALVLIPLYDGVTLYVVTILISRLSAVLVRG